MLGNRLNLQFEQAIWPFDFRNIHWMPGWRSKNNSSPLGTRIWFQGFPLADIAQSGSAGAYIMGNYRAVSGSGTISLWLFTPEIQIDNEGTFSFYTLAAGQYADRLQVRYSESGDSIDVGTTESSVGDFTGLMFDINPTLTTDGYPLTWTKYDFDFSTVSPSASGRIGFRYYVTDGGPLGTNSNAISIDTVNWVDGA